MKEKIIDNPEIKKSIIIVLVMSIIIMISSFIGYRVIWNEFNSKLLYRDACIIGNMVNKHPELETDIIASFTKNAGGKQIQKGIEIANKYSYTQELTTKMDKTINSLYNKLICLCLCITVASILLIFIGFYISYREIYKKIYVITNASEKIVDGDFSIKLFEDEEGAVSKLCHQFNKMSNNLELSLLKLKQEKIFLKNIIFDISHQLKTPLSSLKIFNELMLDEKIENETHMQFLKRSEQQIERMEWLIINLLKMAKLEAGAIEFKRKQMLISVVLDKVISNLQNKAFEKNQKIEVVNRDDKIYFNYDEGWMEEAISNIVKNSIEHTGNGGIIQVELDDSPVMIKVTVSDNGEGICEEDIPHIFERFYKGKNNIKSNSTGIGLALAKAIIENHEGMISVNSKEGFGTKFTVTFLKGII